MERRIQRRLLSVAGISLAGVMLAACSGGPGTGGGTSTGGTGGESAGSGQTVTITGTIVGDEMALLEKSWADFEQESGIDIKYEGTQEFETQISVRAQGGTPPDLAIFPQPGLLADIASRGFLKPAPDAVAKNVDQYWTADWKTYGTVDGTLYGAPLMANVKGWVWYQPKFFADNGYEIPDTWQGVLDLTEKIQADTSAPPWCVGFGSDAATGWPGTDWIEGILLRQSGPEVYDQWISHEVKFVDAPVKAAFDEAAKILLDPKYVNAGYGDVASIATTPFGDPATQLVDGTCKLHYQASFYDGFITPAGGTVGPDGDVWAFMLPGIEAGSGSVVTGGGEIVGAFNDNEATQKVQEFLSSPEWANNRVKLGGVISANSGLDPASASSPILQEAIKILADKDTTFRFDASDLMPGAVGSGSFFKGMVAWVNGTPTDTVLQQIDADWPSE